MTMAKTSMTIEKSEVIILGVSRTSKTPTSIYLAQRGIRTANIPIVPGVPIPEKLTRISGPLIVGLFATAERIAQIRRHRLLSLKENRSTDYIDPRLITDELMLMKVLVLPERLADDRRYPPVGRRDRSIDIEPSR